MIRTSGPVQYERVKGLLELRSWWWVETGFKGCAFRLAPANEAGDCCFMNQEGVLHGAPGYLWDGTSRPIVKGQDTVDVAPSLFHDLIYEGIRSGKLDPSVGHWADSIYVQMLRERGMGPVRAGFRRAALFLFGWTARRRNGGPEYPHRVAR